MSGSVRRSELCSVGTGVTEKVTKIDHSSLGLLLLCCFQESGNLRGHHVWVCRSTWGVVLLG